MCGDARVSSAPGLEHAANSSMQVSGIRAMSGRGMAGMVAEVVCGFEGRRNALCLLRPTIYSAHHLLYRDEHDTSSAGTGHRHRSVESADLRRLFAPGAIIVGAAAADGERRPHAASRRDAVHHSASDLRAVDEAHAARAAGRARLRAAGPSAAVLQNPVAGEADPEATVRAMGG